MPRGTIGLPRCDLLLWTQGFGRPWTGEWKVASTMLRRIIVCSVLLSPLMLVAAAPAAGAAARSLSGPPGVTPLTATYDADARTVLRAARAAAQS